MALRVETFLFAATLVQSFKFGAVNGERPDVSKYEPGLNMQVIEVDVEITPRY